MSEERDIGGKTQRLYPVPLNQKDLSTILHQIVEGFDTGDTLEGSIEFTVSEPNEGSDECYWDVRASYRIGNTEGQGGLRMIGEWKDAPDENPFRYELVEAEPAVEPPDREGACTGCGHSRSAHLFRGQPSYCHKGDCPCPYMHGPKQG